MNDGGKIVNLSTGLTRIIMANRAAYGSIKGAVEVLTKYMAKELGPRGIAVNVVAPGAIATDFSGGVVRDNPEVNKAVSAMTALGRVGVPDDIGPMVASLLSEDNRWINAQRIEVSGACQFDPSAHLAERQPGRSAVPTPVHKEELIRRGSFLVPNDADNLACLITPAITKRIGQSDCVHTHLLKQRLHLLRSALLLKA